MADDRGMPGHTGEEMALRMAKDTETPEGSAPTPKQREEREETVEHLARALRMADCVRLREATGNRHPTWDELREDQRQGYRVEAAHRMASLDSPRKREPKILRLEGTYSGVRFGNAAIPDDITAEEVFERLRTHSPEEPSTPVHDGHCTTCGAPAEIVEGEEGTVSVVRSEEPVGYVAFEIVDLDISGLTLWVDASELPEGFDISDGLEGIAFIPTIGQPLDGEEEA